jgi:hypothetical protein
MAESKGRERTLLRPIYALNAAVESGATKAVFDHIRNYLHASLFFAAGSYASQDTSSAFFGLYRSDSLGGRHGARGCPVVSQSLRRPVQTDWPKVLARLWAIVYPCLHSRFRANRRSRMAIPVGLETKRSFAHIYNGRAAQRYASPNSVTSPIKRRRSDDRLRRDTCLQAQHSSRLHPS